MSETRYEALLSEGRVRLQIRKGDLTQEHVGAIVNAANEYLAHGGGLAAAIVRAGGEVIQEESKAIGRVPTGRAAATGSGALPCDRVIHAVGPIWDRQPPEAADELLASAVSSALQVAVDEGLTSIAIPAISSGIFGFPKDRCAGVMLDTIERFVAERDALSLDEIRLCNFDEPTVSIFEDQAMKRYG